LTPRQPRPYTVAAFGANVSAGEPRMVFSSAVFLFLFLPAVLGLYFILPGRLRNLLLLVVSLFFYSWGEKLYILILLVSITGNYGFGLGLDRLPRRGWAQVLMALAVVFNLGLLGFYKYAEFVAENLNSLLVPLHLPPWNPGPLHLPLGISFFTFHALSYVIDIYRREVRALTNPIDFALYISFFPQSIAGPIVRYHEVAAQLGRRVITTEGFAAGISRFVIGLAKKMLLANTLAFPADAIFGLPAGELTAGLCWLGIVCYTLQIYFDFSGYSDMALGLASMFGFRFPENFQYPYVARSVTEFWRRWHISLSSWFRDYLYIPLGGNRHGRVRTYGNLVLVFYLCGLWHGASWAFIVWGLFHGTFLVLERMGLGRWLERQWTPLRSAYVLLLVMVGWVFFRAPTLEYALYYLQGLAGLGSGSGAVFFPALYLNAEVHLALLAGVAGSLPWLPSVAELTARLGTRGRLASVWHAAHAFAPVLAVAGLLVASAMMLAAGTYNPFIYFRF
jgi:alginate O-acetyltransferase complex protein AlgI